MFGLSSLLKHLAIGTAAICLPCAAVAQDVIFQDDFSSQNFSEGGWTTSGDASVTYVSYSIGYAANVEDEGFIQKVVNASNFTDISVSYLRYTNNYDFLERLTVEWSTNGSTWNEIETYDGGYATNSVSLGSGANNASQLFLRFRSNADGAYERFRIDNVVVSGTESTSTGPQPPQWQSDFIELAQVDIGEAYSQDLSSYVSDPNSGDTITFEYLSGPTWLSLTSNGVLSGTPSSSDEGIATFAVTATDQTGLSADTMFALPVGDAVITPTGCLGGVENYQFGGRYDVETDSDGRVNFWAPDPDQLPEGCTVPIIHHANGTGGRCSGYSSIFRQLASHGFIVACYEDTRTGAGEQCIEAVDAAYDRYPFASNKIGFTGHSQGGGAAFICTANAEDRWGFTHTIAGHAQEPASGYGEAPSDWRSVYSGIRSPMFMFNGSRDTLVSESWVQRGFDALASSTEAYFYEAVGARHIPTPNDEAAESALAWFLWKLEGDQDACRYFKDMPNTSRWTFQDSQMEMSCN